MQNPRGDPSASVIVTLTVAAAGGGLDALASRRYAPCMAVWLALAVVFATLGLAGTLVAWPRLFPESSSEHGKSRDRTDATDDSSS